jgi:spore germination cell wall hydrolase CwlJ-like protein
MKTYAIITLLFITSVLSVYAYMQNKYNNLEKQYQQYQSHMQQEMSDLEIAFNEAMMRARKSPYVQREVECLAKNIYFEAAHEPYAGKMAVATVTKNRVQSNKYPKTFCAVIYQGCQFSWTCQPGKKVVLNSSAYRAAKRVAEEVLIMGKRSAIIDSSVLFYHADYVSPSWSKTKEVVVKIGTHVFYR